MTAAKSEAAAENGNEEFAEENSNSEKLFVIDEMKDTSASDFDNVGVITMERVPDEEFATELSAIERSRKIGLGIALILCAVGTFAALILYSQPNFHENTDAFFKGLIDCFAGYFDSFWSGILLVIGGLVVPLLAIFALPFWDILMTRIPLGDLLENNVKLCFHKCPGVRFLPALITSIYLIIAAFMGEADFNPETYNPFMQQYTAGEWLNFVFMTLVSFAILLIIAEGAVSAGFLGMILHIPLVLAANIYIVVIVVELMFVAVALFGFAIQVLAIMFAIPIIMFMLLLANSSK